MMRVAATEVSKVESKEHEPTKALSIRLGSEKLANITRILRHDRECRVQSLSSDGCREVSLVGQGFIRIDRSGLPFCHTFQDLTDVEHVSTFR